MMKRCWAESLGDCEGGISKEHYITEGMWKNKAVVVCGFDWCKEPVEIRIEELSKRMLCRSHNWRLSALDSEAIRAFKIIDEERSLHAVRSGLRPRYWTTHKWQINGLLLERWFLKTLINIAHGGDRPIGPDSTEPGQPSQKLVRIAYGLETFECRAGLYAVASAGLTFVIQDRFESVPMVYENKDHLTGAFFGFKGYCFILHLDRTGFEVNQRISLPQRVSNNTDLQQVIYHIKAFKWKVREYDSHRIEFSWRTGTC
jgi:hypothetical protein